jgi:hypothetical protein
MPEFAPGTWTATERIVGSIWARELGVADLRPESDFFLLGGDSLRLLNILFRVTEQLNVDLMPGVFFEESTLRGFCGKVDEAREALLTVAGIGTIEQSM